MKRFLFLSCKIEFYDNFRLLLNLSRRERWIELLRYYTINKSMPQMFLQRVENASKQTSHRSDLFASRFNADIPNTNERRVKPGIYEHTNRDGEILDSNPISVRVEKHTRDWTDENFLLDFWEYANRLFFFSFLKCLAKKCSFHPPFVIAVVQTIPRCNVVF